MSVIEVKHITKVFKIPQQEALKFTDFQGFMLLIHPLG
jgi:hypothetical protein